MIDPTFNNINSLFVLLFKNGDDNPVRNSSHKHYMPLVKFKNFNPLIGNKTFFDQPIKNKEVYKKPVEMSRNNDYTTGNLFDYSHHQNHY